MLQENLIGIRYLNMSNVKHRRIHLIGFAAAFLMTWTASLSAAYTSTDKLQTEGRAYWVTGFTLHGHLLDNVLQRLEMNGFQPNPNKNPGPIRLKLLLKDERLHLQEIWLKIGNLNDREGYQEVPITNSEGTKIEDPVYASWFSGTLKHTHWSPLPEHFFTRRKTLFQFKDGVLIKTTYSPVAYKKVLQEEKAIRE